MNKKKISWNWPREVQQFFDWDKKIGVDLVVVVVGWARKDRNERKNTVSKMKSKDGRLQKKSKKIKIRYFYVLQKRTKKKPETSLHESKINVCFWKKQFCVLSGKLVIVVAFFLSPNSLENNIFWRCTELWRQ